MRSHLGAAPSARLIFERRRWGRHQEGFLLRRHLDHLLSPFNSPSPGEGTEKRSRGGKPRCNPPEDHLTPSLLPRVRAQLRLAPERHRLPPATHRARPTRPRDQNKMPARPGRAEESTARAPAPCPPPPLALCRERARRARVPLAQGPRMRAPPPPGLRAHRECDPT